MKLKIVTFGILLCLFCIVPVSADEFYNCGPVVNIDYPSGRELTLVNNEDSHCGTYDEVIDLVEADTTDENQYILDSYNCGEFTRDLHNVAENSKIKCTYVIIYFRESAHALCMFPLNDGTNLFIDAQSDGIARVEDGEHYQVWKAGENDCVFEYDIITSANFYE